MLHSELSNDPPPLAEVLGEGARAGGEDLAGEGAGDGAGDGAGEEAGRTGGGALEGA
jgi:hypothetical protein